MQDEDMASTLSGGVPDAEATPPPEEPMPNLLGVASDATGGLSSEEFVARFRDGWV